MHRVGLARLQELIFSELSGGFVTFAAVLMPVQASVAVLHPNQNPILGCLRAMHLMAWPRNAQMGHEKEKEERTGQLISEDYC